MSIPLEITLDRAGRTPFRLTPDMNSLRWTTAAMGGFGSCTFALPGPPPFWKRELPHLAMLRVVLDTQVIWEGRIEDIQLSLKDESTTVTCFGLQRLLDDVSVRRQWQTRDLTFTQGQLDKWTPDPAFEVQTGNFDPTDLTKSGIRFMGNGQLSNVARVTVWRIRAPTGLTFTFIRGTYQKAGSANLSAQLQSSADFNAYTAHLNSAANTIAGFGFSLVSNAVDVIFDVYPTPAITTTTADFVQFYDLRVLGTSVTTEDASGGFYGGTILRDLIALVPGLTIGIIDDGSDYTIQAIERSIRSASRSVVEEVAGYYTREWRVWEDGRFDWKAVNADEPQWIATVNDLDSGSELTTTVDGLAKTLYILYADAASGLDAESSSTSTEQRNPFVKQGKTKDLIAQPGFPMTSSSSSQLASRLVTDNGRYPLVQGRLVLPATTVIKRASGSPLPAFMIRAGENIVVSDLPKTDLFQQGRDGETLFHIVSTEASLEDGSMTLEVEGQTNRTDVLLARLAAATRTLTG